MAKPDERDRARMLRAEGWSLNKIKRELAVAKSSVSLWTRDVEIPPDKLKASQLAIKVQAMDRQTRRHDAAAVDVETIKGLVVSGKRLHAIARTTGLTAACVLHWCGKLGIEPKATSSRRPKTRFEKCQVCDGKTERNTRFCTTCASRIRRCRVKIAAAFILGGKCQRCGWKPKLHELVALEFHHPSGTKEFGVGNALNRAWEYVLREVRKCQLLCSNCHKLVHTKRDEEFIRFAATYDGDLLPVAEAMKMFQ